MVEFFFEEVRYENFPSDHPTYYCPLVKYAYLRSANEPRRT